jgi:ribosomal protein L40E
MPCYRCGARQVDPVRGHSPWRRGVKDDEQVLVCPGCQAATNWKADLDKCRKCGSVHLVRRLGEVECRDCGTTVPPADGGLTKVAGLSRAPGLSAAPGLSRAPGLSEEVAQALERVLGRAASR